MPEYTGLIDQYKDRDTCYHAWLHYPYTELITRKRARQAMHRWLRAQGFKGGYVNGYY